MDLDMEYTLSLYEELRSIYKSKKVEIFLVFNVFDDKIYIKKILKEYTKDVYENLKNIDCVHIPKIYEMFETENELILIEEYINGTTLQSILEKRGKLDEETVINYMIDLCDALYEIHSLDPPIIHRDIKPLNVMITNDNILKLIDFDISRTYKEGENMDTTLLGTKGYASPEQFGFEQTDCRSDIYALGVMMNVLSVGKHIKEEENKGLLKDIIKKCTNISADKRYPDVLELSCDLEEKLHKNYIVETKLNLNKPDINEKHEKLLSKIPGFRRGNILFMILSSLWYLFLIIGLVVFKTLNEFISNIILVALLLSLFLLYTNFLDVKYKLPFINSKNKSIKIFGYWLYSIVLFLLGGFLMDFFK